MWFNSSETGHEEPLNLTTRQRRKEDVGCFAQDDTATPPPAHQSSRPYLPSPSQAQTPTHYAPLGLLMTPYAREGEDAPQSQVNHYQLNPVVTMLQQRILHDTELLSRMMSLHQANTATTTSLSVTEQSDLVERSRPSYSYRARICGGEFVSDSRGNLLVTDNGQLQERGGEVTETEEKDILDLSLEKNPSSATRSPQFPGSPGLPETEIILKSLSTNHHRPVFWNLLWALLRDQSFSSILCWTDSKDLKFKILNFQFLADTWGKVKYKENMDINNIVKILDLYSSKGLLSKTGVESEYQIMALAIPGDLAEKKK